MMENMKINQLPSKTWNWLKMNETAVSGISVFRTVLRMSLAAWDPIWICW